MEEKDAVICVQSDACVPLFDFYSMLCVCVFLLPYKLTACR